MDDKTFNELIKKGELSLILMDGGADLTPQQMAKVKKTAADLSDARLEEMAVELAGTPGYMEFMMLPLMSKIVGNTFKKTSKEKPNQTKEQKSDTSVKQENTKEKLVGKKDPQFNTIAPTAETKLKAGDSEGDILGKIFNLMVKSYHERDADFKEETKYKEKLAEKKEERSKELIGLFSGKQKKPPKKEPKEKKEKPKTGVKAEKIEPTTPRGTTARRIATTAGAAVAGAAVVGGALTLGNLIAEKGESGKASYNAYNKGTRGGKIIAGNKPEKLEDMTVGEIMARQSIKWGAPNEDQKLFAVGKYQVIPETLSDAVKTLNINKDEKFSSQLQEKIFSDYLITAKRPAIAKYINSPTDDPVLLKDAVRQLSYEWASIADPDKGGMQSHYGSGNRAAISVDEISKVLKIERENHLKAGTQSKTMPSPVPVAPTPTPLPEKISNTESTTTPSVSVLNNNTNIIKGGTTYSIIEEIVSDYPAFLQKQYNLA